MNFSGYLLVYNAFVSANGEEVEETSHHEHLLDVIVDVLNNPGSKPAVVSRCITAILIEGSLHAGFPDRSSSAKRLNMRRRIFRRMQQIQIMRSLMKMRSCVRSLMQDM